MVERCQSGDNASFYLYSSEKNKPTNLGIVVITTLLACGVMGLLAASIGLNTSLSQGWFFSPLANMGSNGVIACVVGAGASFFGAVALTSHIAFQALYKKKKPLTEEEKTIPQEPKTQTSAVLPISDIEIPDFEGLPKTTFQLNLISCFLEPNQYVLMRHLDRVYLCLPRSTLSYKKEEYEQKIWLEKVQDYEPVEFSVVNQRYTEASDNFINPVIKKLAPGQYTYIKEAQAIYVRLPVDHEKSQQIMAYPKPSDKINEGILTDYSQYQFIDSDQVLNNGLVFQKMPKPKQLPHASTYSHWLNKKEFCIVQDEDTNSFYLLKEDYAKHIESQIEIWQQYIIYVKEHTYVDPEVALMREKH
jgi:hypothetical protein